ncbi:hypothetical protein HDV05_006160 [Chytridiales sp. JEL 0842]|nr:hypothetical protein HDV05_006160 [Chytridiales sp. JEL 0842]
MLTKLIASSALLCAAFLASTVDAHGHMIYPYVRLHSSDPNDDFTKGRSPVPHGTTCQGLPKGQVMTEPLAPGPIDILYRITAPHFGGCQVMLDRGNTGRFELIGEDPNCGDSARIGSIRVNLPAGDYDGTIQWFWLANNNRLPGDVNRNENYYNCADISVRSTGSNERKAPINGGRAPAINGVLPSPPNTARTGGPIIGGGGGATNTPPPANPAPAPPANPAPAPPANPAPANPVPPIRTPGNINVGNNPAPAPPAPAPAPAPAGGDCPTMGAFQCVDPGSFKQCGPSGWVTMQCASGTVCKQQGDSILCDFPARR